MKLTGIVVTIFLFSGYMQASYWRTHALDKKAVITVPVADACLHMLQTLDRSKPAKKLYHLLPLATEPNYACYRTHQFLFNEIVTIKRIIGDEVECTLDTFFYKDDNGIMRNSFWTLKEYIMPLKQWFLHNDFSTLPGPYCERNYRLCQDTTLLTLCWPWYNTNTQYTYSAGTRFVRVQYKDTQSRYAIILPDFKRMKTHIAYVPKSHAYISSAKTPEQCRQQFVLLLKQWVYKSPGIISYVWGGTSLVDFYEHDSIKHVAGSCFGRACAYWKRPDTGQRPFTGCECSALVLRAAQICAMPYFYRNTATLAQYLHTLQKTEKLEEGDLIWYQGHVQIVSDIKNNKLIESVGYQSGFGKLHEIELSRVFKNIENYNQLLDAYFKQKQLERLTRQGTVLRVVSAIKIFKLKSIWKIKL